MPRTHTRDTLAFPANESASCAAVGARFRPALSHAQRYGAPRRGKSWNGNSLWCSNMSVCGTVRWENARRDKIPLPWNRRTVVRVSGSRDVRVFRACVDSVGVPDYIPHTWIRGVKFSPDSTEGYRQPVGLPLPRFWSHRAEELLSVSNPECCLLPRTCRGVARICEIPDNQLSSHGHLVDELAPQSQKAGRLFFTRQDRPPFVSMPSSRKRFGIRRNARESHVNAGETMIGLRNCSLFPLEFLPALLGEWRLPGDTGVNVDFRKRDRRVSQKERPDVLTTSCSTNGN